MKLPRPRIADYLWLIVVASLAMAHWLKPFHRELIAERDQYHAEAAVLRYTLAIGAADIDANLNDRAIADSTATAEAALTLRRLARQWNRLAAASSGEVAARALGDSGSLYASAQELAGHNPIGESPASSRPKLLLR